MTPFEQFVEANARWFRGHLPESESSLDAAEQSLGVAIPQQIRWLLRDFGYWHATGISSLGEMISSTHTAREHLKLPARFLVLEDNQDGGVILLDTIADPTTGQCKVYDSGWESVPDRIESEILYSSYFDYVRVVLERSRDFIADGDVDYDPTRYRSTNSPSC